MLFAAPSESRVFHASVVLGGELALLSVSVMTYLQDTVPPVGAGV